MKLTTIITEARSNSENNPKRSVNSVIARYANRDEYSEAQDKSTFVSFTAINKLGINPRSTYRTPIGIYSYPISYVYNTVGDEKGMWNLPFAGDKQYATIFKITPKYADKIVALTSLEEQRFEQYLHKLENVAPQYGITSAQLSQIITDSKSYSTQKWNSTDTGDDGYVNTALYTTMTKLPLGQQLWYITRKVAKDDSIKWNGVFRAIGVEGCVDSGLGIIHPQEPTQAVFFSTASITMVQTVDNKHSPQHVNSQRVEGDRLKWNTQRPPSDKAAREWASTLNVNILYTVLHRIPRDMAFLQNVDYSARTPYAYTLLVAGFKYIQHDLLRTIICEMIPAFIFEIEHPTIRQFTVAARALSLNSAFVLAHPAMTVDTATTIIQNAPITSLTTTDPGLIRLGYPSNTPREFNDMVYKIILTTQRRGY